MMNDVQLQERSLFLKAVEFDSPEAAAAFLDDACGGDQQLRRGVEVLLQANQQSGDLFDQEPTVSCATLTEQPGDTIGPYTLREQIGEGGMGVVYMAEQAEPVKRRVALKIIKPGMDTKEVITRFEAERQALAIMDHPHIARILDAGATDSGRPYFVMELVKGIAITDYCDRCNLTTRERLELFVPVCQTIQHAHQKGLIHRDIKPSNVLIAMQDGQPVPKVIDFGVAKAINQQLTEQSVVTGFAQMVGTPLYMSPEQAELSPLDVDTRSDVYSLGVLLYELLTGTTPIERARFQAATFDELRQIIREEEPARPSARISTLGDELTTVAEHRRTDPRKLLQSVRGELDWIVMKALEKDRNRRYETPSQFADEVQHYLHDEPVTACPPSAAYRFRKFARRNKVALGTTAAIVLSLLLVTGSISWAIRDRMARDQQAMRDRVERQQRINARVDLILENVEQLVEEKNWTKALATAEQAESLISTEEVDEQTREHVREVVSDLELVRQLEEARLIRLAFADGRLSWHYSDSEQAYARTFADAGFSDELTVEQAADRLRAHPRIVTQLSAALTDWARMQGVINQPNDDEGWWYLLDVADAIDSDPWNRSLRSAWKEKGNITALRKLAASDDAQEKPAELIQLLADLLRFRGDLEESARLLRTAQRRHPGEFWINLALANHLLKQSPQQLDEALRFYQVACALRPENASVLNDLGAVLVSLGRLDEAVSSFQRVLELAPQDRIAHYNLGVAFEKEGKIEEALASYRRALAVDPIYAKAHNNLGTLLRSQGKPEEAIASFRQAIAFDPAYSKAHFNLASSLQSQGKWNEAIAHYRDAMALDPTDARTRNKLGNLLSDQGQLVEATDLFRETVELDSTDADAHNNLGNALAAQGKLKEARGAWHRAIECDPEFAMPFYNLGLSLHDHPEQAIEFYRQSITLDPTYAPAHNNLGNVLKDQGNLDEAIVSYRQAIAHDPTLVQAHYNLANAFLAQGKLDEATASYRKTLDLDPKLASAHHDLAVTLHQQHKWDEAIVHSRRAIELSPDDSLYHRGLALALLYKQEWSEALTSYQNAIKLGLIVDAPIGFQLAICYAHLGKQEQAAEWYDKAITLMEEQTNPNEWLVKMRDEVKKQIETLTPQTVNN